jgi:hypothetical protein
VQAVVPCIGEGQGVQLVPQLWTAVSSAHWSPQAWKPGLHMKPHCPWVQVGSPFAASGQGEHDVPQDPIDVSLAQRSPQL